MARGKKDQVVETFEHRSGMKIDLLFDPNPQRIHPETGLTFNAVVGDKGFRFKTAEEVKRAVWEYLDANCKLDWHPVIEITELEPWGANNDELFVGFNIDRYYLAESNDKRQDGHPSLRKLRWDEYTPDKDRMRFDSTDNIDFYRIQNSQEFHAFHLKIPDCLPYREKHPHRTGKHSYLLYDESVWVALQSIQEGITRLKRKLRTLTGTNTGIQQLTAMGSQLLNLLPENVEESVE